MKVFDPATESFVAKFTATFSFAAAVLSLFLATTTMLCAWKQCSYRPKSAQDQPNKKHKCEQQQHQHPPLVYTIMLQADGSAVISDLGGSEVANIDKDLLSAGSRNKERIRQAVEQQTGVADFALYDLEGTITHNKGQLGFTAGNDDKV